MGIVEVSAEVDLLFHGGKIWVEAKRILRVGMLESE
jgi:hypothetical protein